jgi:GNAT superfamily N-acetyltransferase
MEKKNKFIEGRMTDNEGRGYVSFRSYDDGVHVLMGSYTDKEHRGKGIFRTQFERFMNEIVKEGDTVYIALINRKILPYLKNYGFKIIKTSVPHWGKPGNGINLKMKKGVD